MQRTLHEESRRNELNFAYGRSVLLGLTAAVNWSLDLIIQPGVWSSYLIDDVVMTVFFVLSLVLVRALRRGWYWNGLPFVVPTVDACAILSFHMLQVFSYGSILLTNYQMRTPLALLTALLALSGCIRFNSRAAYFATSLALGVYVAASGLLGWMQTDLLALVGLSSIGYIGIWLTRVVRRAVEDEVARNTLQRFLPESVIEHAHHDPLTLLTEPRLVNVTIVVTDIRGFTSYADRTDPAVVFQVLNEIQGTMAEVIRRHAGTIDKFTGDGMLAVFGISPLQNHANNALRAVQSIRVAANELRAASVRDFDLRLGIGVHSGTVQVGCVGGETRLEFTVIGDVVNTTFRLQDLTKDLKVDTVLSLDAVKLAGGTAFHFRSLGAVAIRGKVQPLEVFAMEEA